MARRKRSDSATAQAEMMQKAAARIEPPVYVKIAPEVLPYWYLVVGSKQEWLAHELILAADLAQIYHDIIVYSQKERVQIIETDNYVKEDVSAAHKILKDLTADALRLCRTLQIHARAVFGESEDQRPKNQDFRKAKNTVDSLGGLIARPKNLQ